MTDLRLKITCLLPLRSKVRTQLAPKTLCENVSSHLRKDGDSTKSELFRGLPLPIKLEKSLNNLKSVVMTLNPFNSIHLMCKVYMRQCCVF